MAVALHLSPQHLPHSTHTPPDVQTRQRTLVAVPSSQQYRTQEAGVYLRRRLVAGLVAVFTLAGLWTVASLALDSVTNTADADLTPAATAALTETYVVQPGDTFWSIAATIDTDGDLRDTVDRLVEANGGSATLRAGDRLSVPVG